MSRPDQRRLRRCARIAVGASFAAAALALAATAGAEDRVTIHVSVHQVSRKPGPVDPEAADLDRRLSREFGFRSAKRLAQHDLRLALGETGSVQLPSGRSVTVKPRKRDARGLLMTVVVDGRLRTSLRTPSGHQVVIGAESNEAGKIVVTLVPEY